MSEDAQYAEVLEALAARDSALLMQLIREASTDAVREIGCLALADVAKSIERTPGYDTARDVVEMLLPLLVAESVSVDVVIAAFSALHDWCSLVPQIRVPAGERGAVGAVVEAMRVDTTNARLQAFGCHTLAGLLVDTPANQRLAVEADAVAAVLATLRRHASFGEMQFWACDTLNLLMAGAYSGASAAVENRETAVAHGAIELVAAALDGADAKLSHVACSVLRELIALVPENSARAQRCGALEAILKAMRLYTRDLELQTTCCTVLCRMGLESSALAAAEGLDAHAAIIHAMERFPAANVLQRHGCFALSRLLPTPSPDNDAKHAGAVACVVNALRAHGAEVHLQKNACTALFRLVEDQPLNSAEAFRLGAIPALCEVFETHKTQLNVVEPCLKVLASVHKAAALLRDVTIAHPGIPAAVALEAKKTEAKRQAQPQPQAQARAQAQAQAETQAQAREEAARRADAMAAALIAEEEEAARAAAAPPARKSRKKRGGGAAAGGQRAEPASSESAQDVAPDSAAALSELALNDAPAGAAGGASDTPSAAAARRRRRAATKAARRRAGSGADGEAAARGAELAFGGEDEASETEPDAGAAAALPPPDSLLPPDAEPAPTPAAPLSPPPPPAAMMPAAMSECCVCLSDMPAAQLLVVVPCGHRCLCPHCWEQLEPPTARRCPICNAPAVMAMRVFDHL
jgi:hypothetical protein